MSVFSCEESAETLDGELAEPSDEKKLKVENDFEKAEEPIVENDFEKADEPIVENDLEKVEDEPGIFQILDRLEKATDTLLSR
jgi:hypothetical protein